MEKERVSQTMINELGKLYESYNDELNRLKALEFYRLEIETIIELYHALLKITGLQDVMVMSLEELEALVKNFIKSSKTTIIATAIDPRSAIEYLIDYSNSQREEILLAIIDKTVEAKTNHVWDEGTETMLQLKKEMAGLERYKRE